MHILSTDRLHLRKMSLADAPFFLELVNSPGWLQYIGDRGVQTVEQAENYIRERILPAMEQPGIMSLLVNLQSTGEAIGNCGFYKRDYLDVPDLGFAFLPQYLRKGYGYEAAKGCLEYGVEQLQMTECAAITVPDNKASVGLLKKLGFTERASRRDPDSGADLLIFHWKA